MGHFSQVLLPTEIPCVGELSPGSYWSGVHNPVMVTVSLEWLRSVIDEVP
jgi:hypothetical protein